MIAILPKELVDFVCGSELDSLQNIEGWDVEHKANSCNCVIVEHLALSQLFANDVCVFKIFLWNAVSVVLNINEFEGSNTQESQKGCEIQQYMLVVISLLFDFVTECIGSPVVVGEVVAKEPDSQAIEALVECMSTQVDSAVNN